MTAFRLAVVGNPANRRIHLLTAAAIATGLPKPQVYAWSDVLRDGVVPGPGETVRIDSPGEDSAVDALLRSLGSEPSESSTGVAGSGGFAGSAGLAGSGGFAGSAGFAGAGSGSGSGGFAGPRVAEPGEIVGLAAAYRGLGVGLRRIAAGGGRLLNPVDDVLTMTDKRSCHALLQSSGVPVPEALPPIGGWDDLRAAMHSAGWSRVFVKPAYGSSASGVLALAVAGPRISATTSVERAADGRLFNSLQVRRYDTEADIAAIVDHLAPDGLHVERWFPKAGLGDRALDLRVVVTAGRPRHIVVRTSPNPLTNLHLGNARGEVTAVRAAAGETAWTKALDTCVRAAACFPCSLHVGVDLMFGAGWRRHAVAEVNAFGDLLPGVLSDDRDTYTEQLTALLDGRYETWSAGVASAAPARGGATADPPRDGASAAPARGGVSAVSGCGAVTGRMAAGGAQSAEALCGI